MINVIILLFFTGISFVLSLLAFSGKEIILSNTYLRASEEDRKSMNKRAYCLQSAVIFLALAAISFLNALRAISHISWLSYAALAILVIAVIFAVVSDNMIKKQNKK